tara:strand:- start:5048 stop:5512 length:465 start_codon:yes stop_codon:yes gene_type:complete
MTNTMHGDKAFWEDIKSEYLARAADVATLSEGETEALTELLDASTGLSESVDYYGDLLYEHLVSFVRATNRLYDDYEWSVSGDACSDRRFIAEKAAELSYFIQRYEAGLTLPQVRTFGEIAFRVGAFLKTKPAKYQIERFAEHGIAWEGEARDN